jgi:GT2 family glycosyltransferase
MPRVTVGILTRNRRESLDKAMQSVYAQGYADLEVLVVDSDSDDGTSDLVREKFLTAKLIRLPRNLGCPGGRNHIYANALGDYIVNLDDDGWLGEHALSRIQETFDSDPSIGIVSMRQCYPEEETSPYMKDNCGQAIEVGLFYGGVSAFRRSMLKETGVYPEDFFFSKEEEFLSLRAIDAGYKIVFRPDIIMWHPRIGVSGSDGVSWDYYRFRNPLLVVTRLFPGWLLVKYFLLRLGSYFLLSQQRGSFLKYVSAVGRVLWDLPYTLLTRNPCKESSVRKHLRLRDVGKISVE